MSDAGASTLSSVVGRWRRFDRWRRRRPFVGGVLLVVAGLLTMYLPWAYDEFVLIAAGSFTGPALLLGGLLGFSGLAAIAVPDLSGVLGGFAMLVVTLTIVGALAGFGVGAIVGGVGSVLTFAWTAPETAQQGSDDGGESADGESTAGESADGE